MTRSGRVYIGHVEDETQWQQIQRLAATIGQVRGATSLRMSRDGAFLYYGFIQMHDGKEARRLIESIGSRPYVRVTYPAKINPFTNEFLPAYTETKPMVYAEHARTMRRMIATRQD